MDFQQVKDAANYVSESIPLLPKNMKDLDDVNHLTIYDTRGQTYEGTKLKLEHEDSQWVLTVKLRSGEEKLFTSNEISSIAKHT